MATLLQSTAYVRTFPMYLTGTKTPATGKTVVVNLSKAGAAFGAAAGAVAEISAGWYKVSLTSADTGTLNDLAYNCTNVDCDPTDFTDQVGPIPANMIQINGGATDGNNATLSLRQLNVVNSGGDAAVFSSTGSNGAGIRSSGNGAGQGIVATGGLTGDGIDAVGGATSGSGFIGQAPTQGIGIAGLGKGDGYSGIIGQLVSGSGAGIAAAGNGTGSGFYTIGGVTGHGIQAVGGVTSGSGIYTLAIGSGNGLTALGAGNGHGIYGGGNGTGIGVAGVGGNTGHGIVGQGGASSGNGLYTYASGNGTGFTAVGVGNVSILATQGISGPFDTATYNAITDNALLRDYTAVASGSAPSYCTLNGMRTLRNWGVSGSTFTAYKEDGTTPALTATLTTDAAALQVVAFDSN